MGSRRRIFTVLCGVLLVSAMVLAGCGEEAEDQEAARALVWSSVGGPMAGVEIPPGENRVLCHNSAVAGVSETELFVNGSFANRAANPNPSADKFNAVLTFQADTPGPYELVCVVIDQNGLTAKSKAVTVFVTGEVPTSTTAVEIPTATPTSTEVPPTEVPPTSTPLPPTGTPIPPTATPIPPTSTPIPPTSTPTTPPQPPSITYFRANGTAGSITVNAGTLVTLSWEWQRVSEGYLDPGNIPMACPAMPCTYQVTPGETTTYTLRAVGPGGQTTAQVTVVVIQPRPTVNTGPSITNITESSNDMNWYDSRCTNCPYFTYVNIGANIFDQDGVSGAKVTYRIAQGGQWRSKAMTQTQTALYSATISGEDLQSSLNPPVPPGPVCTNTSTLEYYIQATDGLKNGSQSPTGTVTVHYCYIIT
jgi:hypothetical protein